MDKGLIFFIITVFFFIVNIFTNVYTYVIIYITGKEIFTMRKDKQLSIRLTQTQIDFYKEDAKKYGLNMTDYFKLQNVMFYRIRDLEPELFETIIKDYSKDVSRI